MRPPMFTPEQLRDPGMAEAVAAAARALGGGRLLTGIDRLEQAGLSGQIPVSVDLAKRYRGMGALTLRHLAALGFVRMEAGDGRPVRGLDQTVRTGQSWVACPHCGGALMVRVNVTVGTGRERNDNNRRKESHHG